MHGPVLWGNSWEDLGIAFFVAVLIFVAGRILRKILLQQASRYPNRELISTILRNTRSFSVDALGLFAAVHFVRMPDRAFRFSEKAFVILFLIQIAIWGNALIRFWIQSSLSQRARHDATYATTLGLISFVSKTAFYTLVVLLGLNNLGVNISALLAGLGVGGIAVALAAQNILGDLFASLTIVLDKPFVVGEFIVADGFSGTVEHIGLKTTRLKNLGGEHLVFSNSELLKTKIQNFTRMQERRVVFSLRVVYQTTRSSLERAVQIVREAIEEQGGAARFERAHFMDFSAFSLDIQAVYWVLSPDYQRYMDVHQAILLTIHERFAREKINFAYPTQIVFSATSSV